MPRSREDWIQLFSYPRDIDYESEGKIEQLVWYRGKLLGDGG